MSWPLSNSSTANKTSAPPIRLEVDSSITFPALIARWLEQGLESPESLDLSGCDMQALKISYNKFVDKIAIEAEQLIWNSYPDRGFKRNLLASVNYAIDIDEPRMGGVFVPFFRESVILRGMHRVMLGEASSTANDRLFQHSEELSVQLAKEDELWGNLDNLFVFANSGVIDSLRLLMRFKQQEVEPDASTFNNFVRGLQSFTEKYKVFEQEFSPIDSKVAPDFGSHCFYPMTNGELDALTGAQLVTIALNELHVNDAPSALVERIVSEKEYWLKMEPLFSPEKRPDLTGNSVVIEGRLDALKKWHEDYFELYKLMNETGDVFVRAFQQKQIDACRRDLPDSLRILCEKRVGDDRRKKQALESMPTNESLSSASLDPVRSHWLAAVDAVAIEDEIFFSAYKRDSQRSEVVLRDLLELKNFYDSESKRFNAPIYKASLDEFYWESLKIRQSDKPIEEQRQKIMEIAEKNFRHRHYGPRLIADIAMVVSGFGLLVGVSRVLRHKSFFFSNAMTQRQKDLKDKLRDVDSARSDGDEVNEASVFKPSSPSA